MNAPWPRARSRAVRRATAGRGTRAQATGAARWMPVIFAVALLLSLAVACISNPPRKQPHRGIERLWSKFIALPEQRALAVAGDPDGIWVAGAGSGEASQAAAEKTALAACAAKRAARRMQSPCRLYATGGKIVWPAW